MFTGKKNALNSKILWVRLISMSTTETKFASSVGKTLGKVPLFL